MYLFLLFMYTFIYKYVECPFWFHLFHSFKDMCSFLHSVVRLIKNYELWMNDI